MMNSLGSLRLFVLCFCGIGAVLALHSQDRAAETGSALYDRNHHSRLTRRAGSGEPFQTFHPPVSYTGDKRTPAVPTADPLHSVLKSFNYNQDVSAKSDPPFRHMWPENEFSSSHINDAIDNVDQLNWREAQLARLHGLGPAEIAALSSWQHRLKLHSFNKRLSEIHEPLSSTKDRTIHSMAYRPWMQLAEPTKTNVLTRQQDPFKQVDSHKTNDVHDDEEEDNETSNALSLSLWSKRSPRSGKGKEKNPNNRKEGSSETSPKGNGKGKSGSRKSESNHRITEQNMNKDNTMTSEHFEHGSHENNGRDRGREGSLPSTPVVDSVNRMNRNLATQFLLRSPRENHQYDVPVIECSIAQDGMERFACPTPDRMGRYRCIDDHVLCDGFIDCPGAEDEDGQACMFYKTMKAHLDVVADALLRWVRGR